jgi:hypothetical protein
VAASSRPVVITEHARLQAARRNVPEYLVLSIARSPEQEIAVRAGRQIRQSQVTFADGKLYLVRVVVDVLASADEVVTVYRTSRIAKYWSGT